MIFLASCLFTNRPHMAPGSKPKLFEFADIAEKENETALIQFLNKSVR
jgi:hypothetical protein